MSDRSPPERLKRPNENDGLWLMRKIWDRINRKNAHFMMVIVGEEGSGKSHTAMKTASILDPTFTADRVIFDVAELLRILRDRDHEPGQFYVLDEAGVQLGRRTWQDRGQILTNQCLQLIRNHNLGLIFTLPRLGELDSQAQGRLQAFLELTEKELGEQVRGKFKILDPDRTDETGTIYKKYPRRVVGTGGVKRRIENIGFTPPPEELTDPYEEAKRDFQEAFYEETLAQLEGEEEPGEETLGPKDVLAKLKNGDDLESVVSLHGNTGEPYADPDLLEMEYGLSFSDARKAKKLIERDDSIDLTALSFVSS